MRVGTAKEQNKIPSRRHGTDRMTYSVVCSNHTGFHYETVHRQVADNELSSHTLHSLQDCACALPIQV